MTSVFVNGKAVCLLPGMTVRHALILAGFHQQGLESRVVRDEWGNELGLGGELTEGARIYAGEED